MMKGTPHKITPYGEWSGTDDIRLTYVSADALLCLLFQDDIPNFNILDLFGTTMWNHHNPYFNADLTYEGKYRFKQNYFKNYYNQKLSYLVSRIGGVNQQEAYDVMNRNLNPDRSGNNNFVLDSYIQWFSELPGDLYGAKVRLTQLGYSFQYDSSATVLNSSDRVIGYASAGVYAGMPTNYPYSLNGNFKNGAIANTYESFNAFFVDSVDKADRRAGGQPVLSEFMDVNFSGGPGNVYEPTVYSLPQDSILFPAYASGYNMVDAAYMSMPFMAYRNVVFGDPFVTISYGRQNLLSNVTLNDTTLFMGEVTVPSGKTLTIQNNSTVKFKHQGFITGSGVLNIGNNVTITTNSWSRSLLLCNSGNNPKLNWAAHPAFSTSFYRVYRAVSNTPVSDPSTLTYELRYSTPNASTFSFTDGDIRIGNGQYFYYCVTACQVRTPKPVWESGRSNYTSVQGGMYKKASEEGKSDEIIITDYKLSQNYPNPFNPSTTISYQIPSKSFVTLKVYDLLGNEVTELVNDWKETGSYTVQFTISGKQLASGMYFYTLTAGKFTDTKKFILLK